MGFTPLPGVCALASLLHLPLAHEERMYGLTDELIGVYGLEDAWQPLLMPPQGGGSCLAAAPSITGPQRQREFRND